MRQPSRPRRDPLRCPIEMASFSQVQSRVVYQMALIVYRKHQPATPSAFAGILLSHGLYLRDNGFGGLNFVFISLAKHLIYGGSSRQWRERFPALKGIRAAHKQRTH